MNGYEIGYIIAGFLLIVAIIVALTAQIKVEGTFDKYKEIPSSINMTGEQFARMLISRQGLDVSVRMCKGKLTDNYDPTNKTLNISESNFHSTSIASQAIVAHEFGHALQHAKGYKPLFARMGIIKFSNIMSRAFLPLLILGVILEICTFGVLNIGSFIIYFSVALYGVAVILNLVTLKVEYDASNRAKNIMNTLCNGDAGEKRAVAKLLNSAALTYLASMLVSLAYFLRFLFILLGSRDR